MQQFDVFANRSQRSRERAPYLIVLPYRYFLGRNTTLIAPLIRGGMFRPIPRLNPIFEIEGHQVVFSPLETVTIPSSELRDLILNLETERETIIGALDLVFTGI